MEDMYLGYKGRNYYNKNPTGWIEIDEDIIEIEEYPTFNRWIKFKNSQNGKLRARTNYNKFLINSYVKPLKLMKFRAKINWNICEICGAIHTNKEPFCSGSCSVKYCELHGIWYQRVKLKGFSPEYCKKFNSHLKLRVRAFFNYTCFLCGKTEAENKRRLSVHHVNYDKRVCCNDKPVRLVPLCASCHSKTNKDREYWENYIEGELKDKYNYKCFYTKKEFKIINSGKMNILYYCNSVEVNS